MRQQFLKKAEALRAQARRTGSEGVYVLIALLSTIIGCWILLEITDEVLEGGSHRVDAMILASLRNPADPSLPLGPAWLHFAARDVTSLGGYSILTLVVLAVSGYCGIMRRYGTMLLILVTSAGGSLLSLTLKALIDRPRPEVFLAQTEASFASFPSGHAMLSAAVYLSLAAVLSGIIRSHAGRIYVLAIALLLTGLVGASRVYLGVHYPTDVLAGWAAGMSWALFCWLCGLYLRLRSRAGREPSQSDSG